MSGRGTSEFTGFPAETIRFLEELAVNNERAWFQSSVGACVQALYLDAKAHGRLPDAGLQRYAVLQKQDTV